MLRAPLIAIPLSLALFIGCSESETAPPLSAAPGAPAIAPPVEKPADDSAKAAREAAITIIEQLGGEYETNPNVAGQPVVKVALQGCPVDDQGLAALNALTELQELDLRDCRKVNGAGLASLKDLHQLTILRLSNTSLDDAGAEHLANFDRLEQLGLALCNHLTDDGLVHVGRLQNLWKLDLASIGGMTDRGLASLKPLTKLRWLSLYNAKITDAGLVHLHGCQELETLWLKGTEISEPAVKQLQETLPTLREVHR